MDVRTAQRLLKNFVSQYDELKQAVRQLDQVIGLLDGKEDAAERLRGQVSTLEVAMIAKRDEFSELDRTLTLAHDEKVKTLGSSITQLTAEEVTARRALEVIQRDHAVMVERGRQAQREITEGLISERHAAISELDRRMTEKQHQLAKIEQQLAQIRTQVGV